MNGLLEESQSRANLQIKNIPAKAEIQAGHTAVGNQFP